MYFKVAHIKQIPLRRCYLSNVVGDAGYKLLSQHDLIYYLDGRKPLKMINPDLLDYWLQNLGCSTDFVRKGPKFDAGWSHTLTYIEEPHSTLYASFEESVGTQFNRRFTGVTSVYKQRKRGKFYTFGYLDVYARGWGYKVCRALRSRTSVTLLG